MNNSVESIIVNNCQYAPIYLIQDPRPTQANTYVLTPSTVDPPKPISNNLKSFYENSGNIENGLVNVDAVARTSIPKKKECVLIGNNLKLASFLLPKTEHGNKQYVLDNIVIKPNIATTTTTNTPVPVNTVPINSIPINTIPVNTVPVNTVTVNTVPKLDIDRKIVKLKEVPILNRTRPEKLVPKIKPKESIPSPNPSKHTSVQLIKLGETYHSLNHLSKDQVKMVNQALKMFKDPDKTTLDQPTYDPVTNTRYIYKVVSPRDLAVVSQKKFVVKDKKLTKIPKKIVEEKMKLVKQIKPVKEVVEKPIEPEPAPVVETKMTRSGRKVKLPKQILREDSPHKVKKKSDTIISCFQCSAEFGSLYRLQKHYENHPTHIPTKIHSNLFHCLLAIIKSGSEGDKTNIFIQQLEQLIVKLKSLLPCLLKKVEGSDSQPCTINEDVGRLFGMNPGKYNIDVGALNCVKDKNGYCIHNPPKLNKYIKDHKPSILSKHNEDMTNSESETENCARINSVVKWPTVSKRIWKLKNKTQQEVAAKKMRLKSEGDQIIDMDTDDCTCDRVQNNTTVKDANKTTVETYQEPEVSSTQGNVSNSNNIIGVEQSKQKGGYIQFHSAHFDIRSSPIKASTPTVFRKFQINPNQLQVIRSLEMADKNHGKVLLKSSNHDNNLQIPMSISNNNIKISMSNSNNNVHHIPISNANNGLHIPITSSNNGLHIPMSSSNSSIHIPMSNSNSSIHIPMSNSNSSIHIPMSNSNSSIHIPMSNSNSSIHIPLSNSNSSIHIPMSSSNNSLHIPMSNSSNSLHIPITSSTANLQVTLSNSHNDLHISLPSTSNGLHVSLPSIDSGQCTKLENCDTNLHETLTSSLNGLHMALPDSDNSLSLPMSNSENTLHIPNTENSLDISLVNTDNSLHDIFKDDVDLSCKDDSNIDPVLKDWIMNSGSKSENGIPSFTKSNSLIDTAFLHETDSVDKSLDKNVDHNGDMPSLDAADNRLLSSQGESVLNFLETLGNELAYPETEIRNSAVDFQLDLFTFNNS